MKKKQILIILFLISLSICGSASVPVKAQGALDHFAITGYPTAVDSGQSFGSVTVTAYDAENNTITDYNGSVYFTSSDSHAVLPYTSTSQYTFVPSDAGAHQFSSFAFGSTSSETITVTDGSAGVSTQSSVITVNTALVAPNVTSTPSTVNQGQTSNLSSSPVATGTSPYAYQWFEKTPTAPYAKVGTNSASYSFITSASTATGSYSFLLQVTDNVGAAVNSTAVSVTVNPALVAPTASASPTSVTMGQTAVLNSTAEATGTSPYSYQWYSKVPAASSFTAIGGATSSAYSFVTSGSTANGTWSFQLQVTDATAAVVTSNAAAVTVNPALAVSVSPTSWVMDLGQSETFSASASGGSGTLTYQWYLNNVAVTGATAATYTYTPSSSGSPTIYCKVTDQATPPNVSQSNTPSVTVNSALTTPSASASASNVDQGQTSTLSATAPSGGTAPYSYQWLQEAPGATSYSPISGATSSSYSFATSTSTTIGNWSFELQVTDSASVHVVVTSNAVSVKVTGPPTVSLAPASLTMEVGQSKTFTATPSGGSGTYTGYQWYVAGAVQPGQTASNFSYSPLNAGVYSITVAVTDSLGVTSAQSAAATVTVQGALSVSVSPATWTMDVGQSETFTANPAGGSNVYSSYQWYVGGVAQSGKTTSTFSYSPSAAGSPLITVTVTDSLGVTSAPSGAPSVTVNAAPTVSVTPASRTMDVGQSATFTATATGGSGAYVSYQWFVNGVSQSGKTAATFNYSTQSAGSYLISATAIDSLGVTASSSGAATVTVAALPTVTVAPAGPLNLDAGQTQTFTASATGGVGALSYQWYLDNVAVGSNSAAYSYTASLGSHSVTCQVTDSASPPILSAVSNAVTITATAAPTPTLTPAVNQQSTTGSPTATPIATPPPSPTKASPSPSPTPTSTATPSHSSMPINTSKQVSTATFAVVGPIAAAGTFAIVMLLFRRRAKAEQAMETSPENGIIKEKSGMLNPSMQLIQEPEDGLLNQPEPAWTRVDQNEVHRGVDKVTCPTCKEEFSAPPALFESADSKQKLVDYCPYCSQPQMEVQKSNSEQDLWKKYFKSSA